jgi:hypothetical protein
MRSLAAGWSGMMGGASSPPDGELVMRKRNLVVFGVAGVVVATLLYLAYQKVQDANDRTH